MDINTFQNQLFEDKDLQDRFINSLAKELKASGFSGDNARIEILSNDEGKIDSLLFTRDRLDADIQLSAAKAAVKVLDAYGVQDLTGIVPLDTAANPLALNVVYKSGGWIVNTREAPGGLNDSFPGAVWNNDTLKIED